MAQAVPADDIDALEKTAEAQRILAHLKDREWRLDNLYWIKDENGDEIQFKRNEAQQLYFSEMHNRDLIVKARRLGFSTFIAILDLDDALFRRNHVCAVIDKTLNAAKEKLQMVSFSYKNIARGNPELRASIHKNVRLTRENTEELAFSNGSKISVGTSYRGGGLQNLHVSEYGKISTDTPDVAKEIKKGSIRAVPIGGWCAIESTAHGTSGEFYEDCQTAQKRQQEGQPLTALDFKLHFFGWWIKREHRLPYNLVVIPIKLKEYFASVEERLWKRHRIRLDADQMAWYTKQYEDLGPDDCKEEFPTLVEETFYKSIEGAFWGAEIAAARNDGRIGKPVPHDPTRLVDTWWDIGEDGTAIGFSQTDGVRNRVIDYWEMVDGSLQIAKRALDEKRELRGFQYGKHYGPHDLDNADWAHESKTRKQVALDLGIKFTVVPKIQVKGDSIEIGRRQFANTWIDSEHGGPLLVTRLENYRKTWNKALGVFTSDPVHDMASHGSDAWQQWAMGSKPERLEGGDSDRHRRRQARKRTGWGA